MSQGSGTFDDPIRYPAPAERAGLIRREDLVLAVQAEIRWLQAGGAGHPWNKPSAGWPPVHAAADYLIDLERRIEAGQFPPKRK